MQQQIDVFVASLTSFWTQLAGFVPQLLAALLLLFVGWILASLIRTGVVKLLDVLKFDELSQKTGIDAFLKQGNINISLSRIVAILVLVFGVLLARFINRLVFAYLNNMGMEGALTLSTISEYAVIIFVIFVALEQLEIGTHLLTAAFQIGFGAIALALALAFGLGGKDWAAGVIKRMTEKRNGS